jgi:hypothetical protein
LIVNLALTISGLLAAGPEHPNLWNPTIIGILTFVSALVLFCGSVYLLLGTNMGARLGFLVSMAGLTGFMLLLAALWWTSGSSGIDPPHGASPSWHVVEVVDSLEDSEFSEVTDIAEQGRPITPEALTNLKASVDAGLVQAEEGEHGGEPEERPFARFGEASEFLIDAEHLQSFERGGGTKNLFWHHPRFAAVQLCEVQANSTPPVCDPLGDTPFVVLEYDHGSLRQPVVAYFFMSLLLFALSLLGLHWYEQDHRARTRAGLAAVPDKTSSS